MHCARLNLEESCYYSVSINCDGAASIDTLHQVFLMFLYYHTMHTVFRVVLPKHPQDICGELSFGSFSGASALRPNILWSTPSHPNGTVLQIGLEIHKTEIEGCQDDLIDLEINLVIIQVIDQMIEWQMVEMILNKNPTVLCKAMMSYIDTYLNFSLVYQYYVYVLYLNCTGLHICSSLGSFRSQNLTDY